MALETYRRKRQFSITPEPRGRIGRGGGSRYVIQKHAARRLHYDLRLELDGVMKSWAVTRGPSLDPGEKRLAVHVEDHPVEYNTFEGTIPAGEYGGGTVMVWDRGRWTPQGDPHAGYAKGHLVFDLNGEKLHGRWHLVRMRGRPNERHDNWLLIKAKDEDASTTRDILEEEPLSAATGRSIEEIAGGKGRKRVWHSNRARGGKPDPSRQSQSAFKEELRAYAQKGAPAKIRPKARPRRSTLKSASAKVKSAANGAVEKKVRKAAGPATAAGRARLPDFIPPSLATLRAAAPSGPQWLHEIKYDGYRIEARLDRGKVRLLTRHQQDWTARFATIAEAVAALPAETAIFDGELVVEDQKGISNFSLLQTDLKNGRNDRLVYWVFDLLYLDGRDLAKNPLVERKAALARLLRSARTGPVRYAGHFDEEGPLLFKHACAMGLEGIVSKQRDAPYRSGRSENFIKTKCHNEQEFVVAGFSPSTAMPGAVGALTVAFHENGALRYAGRIGTGYTRATARELWQRLQKLRIERPPVALPADERRKNVIWVKPQLVVEAEFRGITHDGLLRQASYKGLREDKPAREVVRETPLSAAASARAQPVKKSTGSAGKSRAAPGGRNAAAPASVGKVRLTHADRVYWTDVGVTKQDLAEYYVSVWPWIEPHIVGRALSLVRAPEGVGGESFFQKHIAATIKSSPLRQAVPGKDHDVIAIKTLDDLIALVQTGALEIHVRGSRLDSLETCDRVVFDLDPGERVGWDEIVAAARETRDRLQQEKLESYVKLSGGKGIHVVVPIDDTDWDTVKDFAQRVALRMAADDPRRYVGKMTKSLRDGRIFIDYFRNSREATSVAPYSTRARAGAPVSAPLSWDRLASTTAANEFTVLNLKKHFKSDPWHDIGKVRQRLPTR